MKAVLALSTAALLLIPAASFAYPNGTLFYVTDTGPFCASCHSAAKAEYMPELPPGMADKETPETKHYGTVRMPGPPSPYWELTDEQKERLISTAKDIDSNSSISLSAPSKVKVLAEVKVTVKARGGNGPVIGVMLVDRALRFQSRPVSADGWVITAEPVVKGEDGLAQKAWADRRIKDLKRNLNFVLIENVKYDAQAKRYPSGEVTYTLKAPSAKGTYTLAAALLYGTENAEKAAFFQRPSGRILFSEEVTVRVE